MKWMRADRWTILALLGIFALFFWRELLVQGTFFYGDIGEDYYPRLVYVAQQIRAGHLPLWQNELSGGYPAIASPAGSALYPIGLALFLALPGPAAINYYVILHFMLAGVGTYLFARRLNIEPLAALVAGLTFGLSGHLVAHLMHINILVGWAWMPFLLLLIETVLQDRRTWKLVLFGPILVGLLGLGGHPQILLYALVLAGGYGVARNWMLRRTLRESIGFILSLGAVIFLGVGLAAVWLVPSYEVIISSPQGGRTFAEVTAFSLPPENLLTYLWPYFFGGPQWGAAWGRGSFLENAGYVGILPLTLAGLGVWLKRRDGLILFFGAVVLVCWLFALGQYTPLSALLYRIPLFSILRAPSRLLGPAAFAIAMLAAFGLEAMREKEWRKPLLWVSALIGLMVVGVIAVNAVLLLGQGVLSKNRLYERLDQALKLTLPQAYVPLLLMLGTLAVLWMLYRGFFSPRIRAGLVVALVAVDLFLFGYGIYYNQPASLDVYNTQPANAALLKSSGDDGRIYYWAIGESKTFSYLQNNFLNRYTLNLREGMRSAKGLEYGVPAFQGYLMEVPAYGQVTDAVEHPSGEAKPNGILLGRYNVRYLLTQSDLQWPDVRQLAQNGGVRLYEITDALPRVYLAYSARVVTEQAEGLRMLSSADFNARSTVLLDRTPAQMTGGSVDPNARVQLVENTPEHPVVEVTSAQDSYLVMNDTYYPGWTAQVDGTTVPIYRANLMMRAVGLSAGTHRVEFSYQPVSLQIGAAISIASAILTALWLGLLQWLAHKTSAAQVQHGPA